MGAKPFTLNSGDWPMPQNIAYGANFNPLSVYVPGLYQQVIPPQTYFSGVPVSIAGFVGTAPWGPLNSPQLISTPAQQQATFGGMTVAGASDIHDLNTDIYQMLLQGGPLSGLAAYCVRVSDGTDNAASIFLTDLSVTPVNILKLTAIYTGTAGNQIAAIVQNNPSNGTLTLVISPFAGGGSPEYFTNLPNTTGFGAAALLAVNNGQGLARGPSQFVRASAAMTGTLLPKQQTYTLAGGADGRAVTTAQLVGTNVSPPTGVWALQNTQFPVSVAWCCGLTDVTGLPTFQSFCDKFNVFGLFQFATGDSVSAVVTAVAAAGVLDYQIGYLKGFVWFLDPITGNPRLITSYATAGGTIATLPPWVSPTNKTVKNILGTETNNPFTGTVPYAYSDYASLGQAGVMLLDNPIQRGSAWGFINGYNSVGNNAATAYVEYSRLTNYIVATNANILGQYVGENQGFTASDPVRAQVRAALNNFFQQLQDSNYIGSFNVQADLNNNSQTTIAQHELAIYEQIQYNASIQVIFVQTQGGTTVVPVQTP